MRTDNKKITVSVDQIKDAIKNHLPFSIFGFKLYSWLLNPLSKPHPLFNISDINEEKEYLNSIYDLFLATLISGFDHLQSPDDDIIIATIGNFISANIYGNSFNNKPLARNEYNSSSFKNKKIAKPDFYGIKNSELNCLLKKNLTESANAIYYCSNLINNKYSIFNSYSENSNNNPIEKSSFAIEIDETSNNYFEKIYNSDNLFILRKDKSDISRPKVSYPLFLKEDDKFSKVANISNFFASALKLSIEEAISKIDSNNKYCLDSQFFNSQFFIELLKNENLKGKFVYNFLKFAADNDGIARNKEKFIGFTKKFLSSNLEMSDNSFAIDIDKLSEIAFNFAKSVSAKVQKKSLEYGLLSGNEEALKQGRKVGLRTKRLAANENNIFELISQKIAIKDDKYFSYSDQSPCNSISQALIMGTGQREEHNQSISQDKS